MSSFDPDDRRTPRATSFEDGFAAISGGMSGDPVDCCDAGDGCDAVPATAPGSAGGADFAVSPVSRRTFLKGLVGAAGVFAFGGGNFGRAQNDRTSIRLAFCSQLLCVVPYEFTRARGYFSVEGLDVELVYTRGGGAAMQALQGGAVDYAATSFDAALNAFANGAQVRRFATTGRLPLFALVTAPEHAAELTTVADLAGRTIGVSALGNADHVLVLYLLQQAGVDPASVEFAALGVNLYHALRLGQVDAGMVQEPSLSLLEDDGAATLFNAMRIEEAEAAFGGAYEFMGVAVRADELAERQEQMEALASALTLGLRALKTAPVDELVDALPAELIAGDDTERLRGILERYRGSLYPDDVLIDVDACRRVEEAHRLAGLRDEPVDLGTFLATDVLAAASGD